MEILDLYYKTAGLLLAQKNNTAILVYKQTSPAVNKKGQHVKHTQILYAMPDGKLKWKSGSTRVSPTATVSDHRVNNPEVEKLIDSMISLTSNVDPYACLVNY